MASPTDSNVQLPGGTQTGPQVRSQQLYILDSGVLTPVQMQVIQVADDTGTIVGDFVGQNVHMAILIELRAIRRLIATRFGVLELIDEDPPMSQQS